MIQRRGKRASDPQIMSENDLKNIEKTIKALADKNRIRIIYILKARRDLCVCEITDIIGLSQPTISSHLKLLENAGLLESYKNGLWVNYNISSQLDPSSSEILEIIYNDLEKDKQILSDMRKLKNIDRDIICSKDCDDTPA
ncbi:MAG: metalloregulator ArsR/SmtB family transcription factor [Actinobacteria bacterium]|nr:metalloregulator ArsR/SmtB family transcription factor [Actinomycetota bacterium]